MSGAGERPDASHDGGGSLAAVRETELLLDALASRVDVVELDAEDRVALLLAGWTRTIDSEVDASTAARAGGRRRRHGDPLAQAVAGARAAPQPAGTVLPVAGARGRDRRGPSAWWAMSAAAAAVILVLGAGAVAHDAQELGPQGPVETAQSVDVILSAALLAAERGDVVGARVLLEQVRLLLDDVPAQEREQLERALAETTARVDQAAARQGGPEGPDGVGRGGSGQDSRGEDRGQGTDQGADQGADQGGAEDGGEGQGGQDGRRSQDPGQGTQGTSGSGQGTSGSGQGTQGGAPAAPGATTTPAPRPTAEPTRTAAPAPAPGPTSGPGGATARPPGAPADPGDQGTSRATSRPGTTPGQEQRPTTTPRQSPTTGPPASQGRQGQGRTRQPDRPEPSA